MRINSIPPWLMIQMPIYTRWTLSLKLITRQRDRYRFYKHEIAIAKQLQKIRNVLPTKE